jgi:hypothetical protein
MEDIGDVTGVAGALPPGGLVQTVFPEDEFPDPPQDATDLGVTS